MRGRKIKYINRILESSGKRKRKESYALGWFFISLYSFAVFQLLNHVWLFVTPRTAAQQALLPCPSPSPGACSNSFWLSQWCHPTISPSVATFSSCPQSFPASGSFPMGWLFALDGQSVGALASVSVLPINIQGWFPLGLIGLISLLSKGL